MTAERDTRSQRRYRVAFAGTAMLMLGIVVTLPFSLASVVDDVLGPAAVLLVLLIAAAAVYSVLLRRLEDLIVNSAALVLGVWGIRTILVPINIHYQTAVDLSLSMVILFLLGGVTVKALMLAHDRGGLRVLRRSRRTARGEGGP